MQRKKQLHSKVIFIISFLFTITVSLQAQAPRTISFQGSLTNPDGSNLNDGTVSLEFMLYESETGGTAIWTETQSVNVKNSLFTAILGKVTPLTAAFDKPYWVGIKVSGNSELSPRLALTSSPYSLGGTATVTEPGPGQNFQVKDSTGVATHIINSNGDTWSAGTGTFGNALVVGDTTVVPDTSTTSIINTNKIKFGINKTLGTLGTNTGGRIGIAEAGVWGWAKGNEIGVLGQSESGNGVSGFSPNDGNGIFGNSTNGAGVFAVSKNGNGVTTTTTNGTGIDAFSATGLAGRFGGGNVYIEKKLKIDVVPTTTETSYMVWSSDHFVKVNSTPLTFGGTLEDKPLKINNAVGTTVVTLSTNGTTTQTGKATLIDGWQTTLGNGNIAVLLPSGGFQIKTPAGVIVAHIDPNGNGFLAGNLQVNGSVSKGSGSFKIDHPLDPLNKNLYHSFVESPDMMNVYNGNIILDDDGEATIELPDWFEALNKDFRYQLTPIGEPGPNLYVSQKIKNNTFKIAGGKAGMEVSWQITGIRHDPYANLHRIKVEEEKPIAERGKYLHPDAYKQTVVDNK